MGLLLNKVGALVTEDTEKAELLNAAFSSVFIAKASRAGRRDSLDIGRPSLG